ncbi:FAD-dependent monooxygenase OpS4 [Lasiodiplodia hormozganensis]|uniref:FAD-dependent monooxygenase OpS4 n=1 Tax=Lasiodiplodia hormozganensis TaxID=869390 RepID=A0AA39Y3S2_9PEZI|nr:FAD-dependent monooxygenase OpS4 [Lasiodiplodia hormozganensis]
MLVQEALKAGINVTVGCKVAAIDEEKPAVELEDGSELKADIIIGADGIGSITRKCILPQTQGKAVYKLSAWMVNIPIPILQQDPELQPCLEDVNFWLGPGRSITAATVPDQDAYNMTLVVDHANHDAYSQDEGQSFEQIKELFHNFEPTVTKLLSRAPTQEGYLWRISEVPPLPTWISKSGRVILLGDAAHSMVPFAAQGASQCIEDAGALAECLSRDADLMDLLRVFEMIRKPRVESVAARSAARQLMFHLPDGPKQQERDEKMRLQVRSYEPDMNVWNGEHIDEPPEIDSPLHDPYLMGHDVIQYAKRVLDRELGRAKA